MTEFYLSYTNSSNSNAIAAMPIWTSEGQVDMPLQNIEIDAAPKTTPFERAFNPYDFNGGYVFAKLIFFCYSY